jgi:hypothetical protein
MSAGEAGWLVAAFLAGLSLGGVIGLVAAGMCRAAALAAPRDPAPYALDLDDPAQRARLEDWLDGMETRPRPDLEARRRPDGEASS